MKIVIDGELIDLNKYINAQRANRYGGASVKKKYTQKCAAAFLPIRTKKLKFPITLHVTWFCKDKRKDKDNIAFAKKFILDGMIQSGLIANDGWQEIEGFTDNFEVDKSNPRVEIKIEEEPK